MKKLLPNLLVAVIVLTLWGFSYKLSQPKITQSDRILQAKYDAEQLILKDEIVDKIKDHAAEIERVESATWLAIVKYDTEFDTVFHRRYSNLLMEQEHLNNILESYQKANVATWDSTQSTIKEELGKYRAKTEDALKTIDKYLGGLHEF